MARQTRTRRKSLPRRVARSKATAPASSTATTSARWPNIESLIDAGGAITISTEKPIGCFASAADEDICYAMLVRRDGESLHDLLLRLDQSIATASETSRTVDEVNP